jgi:hypothetical protein
MLQRELDALQGVRGSSGKADTKIASLFARHGKAYNLVKYAAAVVEGSRALVCDDSFVSPDYGSTPDKPGPLETVLGDWCACWAAVMGPVTSARRRWTRRRPTCRPGRRSCLRPPSMPSAAHPRTPSPYCCGAAGWMWRGTWARSVMLRRLLY